MQRSKILTIIIFILFVSGTAALAVYGYFYVRKAETKHRDEISGLKEQNDSKIGAMQQEISRLRQLQQEFASADALTSDALDRERRSVSRLKEKIELLIAQNRSLSRKIDAALSEKKELLGSKGGLEKKLSELEKCNKGFEKEVELLRRNFDVAAVVKSRLAAVREEMDGLIIKKGKEDVLSLQLDALEKELGDINSYLTGLRQDRIALNPQPLQPAGPAGGIALQDAKEKTDPQLEIKYLEQVNDLKARINILANENTILKEKYLMAQDVASEHKKILDAGSRKIFALQSRLIETENALSLLQTRYADLERSSASLRERYVANELEKEGLKIKLNQLTAELNDVRGKFLALLGKISDIFKAPDSEILSSQRRDFTGSIGVELFANSTDQKR
ncbi:MAG: hypothetical protein MUC52_02070 [Candidatus Omnitrophica bacterium]|jgi:chromosome segregation ATPase|nr:hypothetical protein [Candidatus Omnitrophota bacterium]